MARPEGLRHAEALRAVLGAEKRQKWESAQREEHLEQVIKVGKWGGIKAVLPYKRGEE